MKLSSWQQSLGLVCLMPALLLPLSACKNLPSWAGADTSGAAKLTAFKAEARFVARWQTELGASSNNILRPAVKSDAIFAASEKGVLFRIDPASGKPVWKVETGVSISGGVGASGDLVLIGSGKGEVLAFDQAGKLRWRSRVSSEVLNAPQQVDEVVLVRSGDGRIAALNANDGSRLWLYERRTPALVVRNHAGLTVQRGIAYAGFAGGKLVALEVKSGRLVWETTVSQPRGNTELERISDITSNPVVDDEQVCAIAFQGQLACYDITQGSPMWNREIASDKGLMLLRRNLYVSDTNSVLQALDKERGSSLWKNESFLKRNMTLPNVIGDYVVSGDSEGYLHALHRDDGRVVARVKLAGPIKTQAIEMEDGAMLVQTTEGDLYWLTLK